MAKEDFKGLLAKLHSAAEGIKGDIGGIDRRIAALEAEREALTDAPVTREDFKSYLAADVARRGEVFKYRINGFVSGKARGSAKFDPTFARLERNLVAGQAQNFPFMDGEDAFEGFNLSAPAFYWYFGDLIVERFMQAVDLAHDWQPGGIPVAERRARIAEIDAELQSLVEKRDSLAAELVGAGITR